MLKKKRKLSSKTKKILWSGIGTIFIIFLVALFLFYNQVVDGLPSLEELENPKPKLASNIYSSNGDLIGRFFIENRIETNIDSIPLRIVNALIATEDRKFYDHWGVSLERFTKAMIKNIFFGSREGASTITQQMSKNLYELKVLDETIFDTITRKVREWLTAIQIEQTYTKKEILEMYLNISYFGHGAYGIETAAKLYFNKKAKKLSIEEASMLIAILKSSVRYDPINRYNKALQRRNQVIYNMVDAGYLHKSVYDSLSSEPIRLSTSEITKGFRSSLAPHFVEYIRQQMESLSDKYGFNIYRDGLSIYTTLDTTMQGIANRVVTKHLDEFQKLFDSQWNWNNKQDIWKDIISEEIRKTKLYKAAPTNEKKREVYNRLKNNIAFVDSVQRVKQKIETGFVVLDVKSGELRTMIGGSDLSIGTGLNHATQIRRQPGSAFKPIIYTVAIENGLYPAYPILNQPFDFNTWIPHNFDYSTGGFTTLREALQHSVNLIAARLIIEDHVKLYQVGNYAKKMGIDTRLELYPSISLGSGVVTPLEITSVYATLGNKGIYNKPFSITRIEDKDGIVIDQFSTSSREAIPEETAYIVTNMLETVMNEGTGARARYMYDFHRPAGGKTGTNTDFVDAWFVGYTPQLSAGVWVGFDDQRIRFTGNYGQGSLAALPIWAMFMKEVYDTLELPEESFEPPASEDVVVVNFCEESIYDLGDPRLYSNDCNSGKITDLININSINILTYNADRDTLVRVFNKYRTVDSTAHEALEIVDSTSLGFIN